MNIHYYKDHESMSEEAASLVIAEINAKNDLLLCAATGHSPTGLYKNLVTGFQEQKDSFNQLRILKLDEWGDVSGENPFSCEYYLQEHLLKPMGIPASRYISFQANPSNPIEECTRIKAELDQKGPIDICILGIGSNGHIGLNEPAAFLEPHCHLAELSKSTLSHPMIKQLEEKPSYGMTLGIKDIMDSKKIILLISGKSKVEVTAELLSGKISTSLPASLLWLHGNVECLIEGG